MTFFFSGHCLDSLRTPLIDLSLGCSRPFFPSQPNSSLTPPPLPCSLKASHASLISCVLHRLRLPPLLVPPPCTSSLSPSASDASFLEEFLFPTPTKSYPLSPETDASAPGKFSNPKLVFSDSLEKRQQSVFLSRAIPYPTTEDSLASSSLMAKIWMEPSGTLTRLLFERLSVSSSYFLPVDHGSLSREIYSSLGGDLHPTDFLCIPPSQKWLSGPPPSLPVSALLASLSELSAATPASSSFSTTSSGQTSPVCPRS